MAKLEIPVRNAVKNIKNKEKKRVMSLSIKISLF